MTGTKRYKGEVDMIHQSIDIQLDFKKLGREQGDYQPKLYTYVPMNTFPGKPFNDRRPSVLICPGGGYSYATDREGETVALAFLAKGFNCFVLKYSCAPATFPVALLEVAKSLEIIRSHADEWFLDPDQIFVCGFSAGGHLTASMGVFWDKPFVSEYWGVDNEIVKPNGLILSYPVISSGEHAHRGSFQNLLGDQLSEEMLEYLSLEKQVSEKTPPAFLWHTWEDGSVPVENSILFAMALRKYNIPCEMHIYQKGGHGLSLGNYMTGDMVMSCENWVEMASRWMRELGA